MTERIKYLVEKLNEATKAYYQEDREVMSNQEYDALYDELVSLEEKTGISDIKKRAMASYERTMSILGEGMAEAQQVFGKI